MLGMNALNLEFVLWISICVSLGAHYLTPTACCRWRAVDGNGKQAEVDRAVNCNGQDVINGLAGCLGFLGPTLIVLVWFALSVVDCQRLILTLQ